MTLNAIAVKILAAVAFVGFWIIDQLSGEIVTNWVFSIIPDEMRAVFSRVVLGLVLFGFGIYLGRIWHTIGKPISKFKRFLHKAIAQGNLLYQRELKNSNPNDGALGETVSEEFKNDYWKWRERVWKVLKKAISGEYKDYFEKENAKLNQSNWGLKGRQAALEFDLVLLKDIYKSVKTDWVRKDLDCEILEEYGTSN